MKLHFLASMALVLAGAAPAVHADARSQAAVRELEQTQARAAIARDRAALERLFAPDFRIINPAGAVTDCDGLFQLLLGPAPVYASASFETQELRDYGDTIVTIGLETVVMGGGNPAGQTVRRRITQVWHRGRAGWQLQVRHANIVQ